MLNNIRNFSKTWFAKIILVIIVIPFVFWGMGGVFSGGNTNNIAKINNQSISTQDFMDHLNSSGITLDIIKDNINNKLAIFFIFNFETQIINFFFICIFCF